jgi:hypothetical protein
MARKGSAKYQPLSYPNPDTVRIPDFTLLRSKKELRFILEIAAAARENLFAIRGPTGGVELSQALGKMEFRLLDLMNRGQDGDPPGTPGIVTGVRLGYVIGTMENGSGVAHPNQSEAHYTAAMTIISAEIAQKMPPTVMSEFATECGYFLGRSGDEALDTLTDIAEKNGEKLRNQEEFDAENARISKSAEGESGTEEAEAGTDITGAEVGAVTDDDELDEAEVEYDMSAWTSSQCSAFTRRLDEAGIPWF